MNNATNDAEQAGAGATGRQGSPTDVDVVICGGGLAGLTMAMQLRREHPGLSVIVLERTSRPLPPACHKVGESSVELGSSYLERLGLKEYIRENHIIKYGLRFFPGGGKLPLDRRMEIGPATEPVVPSYQLDRGILENDLRRMVGELGATLIEGARVASIETTRGTEANTVTYTLDGESHRLRCRWVVDASGRAALLRREMKLTRGTKHTASAGWFRIDGRLDINDMVPREGSKWHEEDFLADRWRSTNHLMGEGYWAWIIPLSSGRTSIGLVIHEDTHSFADVRSLKGVRAFLEEHEPVLAQHVFSTPALDFLSIRDYSHNVGRAFSPDGWALVGEAGAFVDPLYSPGTDYIAFANAFAGEVIRADYAGEDVAERCQILSLQYRALVSGNADVYRTASKVYGHGRAMLTKIYWDNFAYWSFPCQYFMRRLYELKGPAHARVTEIGQRFVQLSQYAQNLLGAWAELVPEEPIPGFFEMPGFPSILIDVHCALHEDATADEATQTMAMRADQAEEILAELLVRVLQEVGSERAASVFEKAGCARWQIQVAADRVENAELTGMARRRGLSTLGRDVERCLGRPSFQTPVAELQALLAPLLKGGASAHP